MCWRRVRTFSRRPELARFDCFTGMPSPKFVTNSTRSMRVGHGGGAVDEVQTIESFLVSAEVAAQLVGVSRAQWFRMHSAGKSPLPVKIGRRRLWSRDELRRWCEAACPARDKWNAIKGNAR